jgi:hypothetical protein
VIILDRDGSLFWSEAINDNVATTMEHVFIPADLALQQTATIVDRILEFVFDILCQDTIEMHIYEDRNS